MFDDVTSTPYDLLFLGRLPSWILNCERCRSYTLNTENCQHLLRFWMKVLAADLFCDNGNGNHGMSYIPNRRTCSVVLPVSSTLTLTAIRAFSEMWIKSIWFLPSSVRKRKVTYTQPALIYSHLDALWHTAGINNSPCCIEVCQFAGALNTTVLMTTRKAGNISPRPHLFYS